MADQLMSYRELQLSTSPWRTALPWLVPAALLVLGALFYYLLIYVPTVDGFNRGSGFSAGNGSDLYSRWYGTRELLLHGRDPYSDEITVEMQRAFVGRDPQPGEAMPTWSVFAQP